MDTELLQMQNPNSEWEAEQAGGLGQSQSWFIDMSAFDACGK